MRSVEQLTNLLQKEEELAERHRKKAADLKKQIELYRCDIVQKKLNSLNLSASEYDKVMSLLASGKGSILAAAEIVLADPAPQDPDHKSDVPERRGDEDEVER